MMRKLLLLFYFLLTVSVLAAQKKIVLEKIRYSTAINYLEQVEMQQLFAHHLNELLLKYQQAPLTDTNSLPLLRIQDKKDLDQKYDYRQTDPSLLHLLIDIIEIPAATYFSLPRTAADSAARRTARTVFYLNAVLIDANNRAQYNEPLYLVVKNNPGPGMGNESTSVPLLPRTFVGLLRTGLNMALSQQNDLGQVTVSTAPAYMMDNYLVPALAGKQRVYVDTSKGFYHFIYQDNKQLLRQEQPMYEEIIWKGKKARPYPEAVTSIIQAAPNHNNSDFVFLRNNSRDVMNNINYQLQLMVQINMMDDQRFFTSQLSNFMPGNIHVLLTEKDTLALFSITKNVIDNSKKIFPNRIYNGLDTNSVFAITDMDIQQLHADIAAGSLTGKIKTGLPAAEPTTWNTLASYVVQGKIKGQDFTIICGRDNAIKLLYLKKQLVCVVQGRSDPEKFVVFDASLPAELLNPLLLIGFNNFFL